MATSKLARSSIRSIRSDEANAGAQNRNDGHLAWGMRGTPIRFTDETDALTEHVPHLARSARGLLRFVREGIETGMDDQAMQNDIPAALEGVEFLLSFIESLGEVAERRSKLPA